jgi:glutamate-1-semialdehyde 2,1-aminomutase/spore coat polysaccharide biosynthesis protein SpsF
MTTAVIVQARMGSSRLPGKVMQLLNQRTVLAHVLSRCAQIEPCDVVVCAVPESPDSRPLEQVARDCGAVVHRGSEQDVLRRYHDAAIGVGADIVMRVTSDCPLIDPQVCSNVLRLRSEQDADYCANNMPRSFPHGLDCEAFTMAALAEANKTAHEPYYREHVTPCIRRAEHFRRANLSSGDASLAQHRWTLDYPEDLDFFRAVFAALPAGSRGTLADVLKVVTADPAISKLNARHQVPLTA